MDCWLGLWQPKRYVGGLPGLRYQRERTNNEMRLVAEVQALHDLHGADGRIHRVEQGVAGASPQTTQEHLDRAKRLLDGCEVRQLPNGLALGVAEQTAQV
jgi:hypothetical protein